MLAAAGGQTWEERIERTLPAWKGAFSLVLLAADHVIAVRDPWGFRPLSVGRLPHGGHAVASETCALSTLGCVDIDEVKPGEMVTLQRADCTAHRCSRRATAECPLPRSVRVLSRPDSVWDGTTPTTSASGSDCDSPRRRRPTPMSSSCPRLLDPRGHRILQRERHPVQRRADQEPATSAHVHRAHPGRPRARRRPEVQRIE